MRRGSSESSRSIRPLETPPRTEKKKTPGVNPGPWSLHASSLESNLILQNPVRSDLPPGPLSQPGQLGSGSGITFEPTLRQALHFRSPGLRRNQRPEGSTHKNKIRIHGALIPRNEFRCLYGINSKGFAYGYAAIVCSPVILVLISFPQTSKTATRQ